MNPRTLIPFHIPPITPQKKTKKHPIPPIPPQKTHKHPTSPHPPNFPPPPKSSHQNLHPRHLWDLRPQREQVNRLRRAAELHAAVQEFLTPSTEVAAMVAANRWVWWPPLVGGGLALFCGSFCGWEFMIFIKTNLESCHLFLFQAEFWFTMWKWVNPCCQEQSAIAKGKQVLKFQHQMIFVGQGCFKNLLVILSCCRSSRSKNPPLGWILDKILISKSVFTFFVALAWVWNIFILPSTHHGSGVIILLT